jgi:hypothetical protein
MTIGHLWYVRRDGDSNGPFPSALIEKNIVLGRIVADDEISVDGSQWQPAGEYPGFATLQSSRRQLAIARRLDERATERRGAVAGADADQRRGSDRRDPEAPRVLDRRRQAARVWHGLRGAPQKNRWTSFVLAAALLGSILLAAVLISPAPRSPVDCGVRPGPGVNWEFCNKEAADLRGADLRGAVLRNARLAGADLTGADLRDADLAYADLSGAVLRDTNLIGARLVGVMARAASFGGARISNADFEFADLVAAAFDGAVMTGTRFNQAIMPSGITCDPAKPDTCQSR